MARYIKMPAFAWLALYFDSNMNARYRSASQLLRYAFYASALASLSVTAACHRREDTTGTYQALFQDDVKLMVREVEPGRFQIESEEVLSGAFRAQGLTDPEWNGDASFAVVQFLDGRTETITLPELHRILKSSGNNPVQPPQRLAGYPGLMDVLVFSNLGFMAGRLNNGYYRSLEERSFRPEPFYLDSVRYRRSRSNLRYLSSTESYRPTGASTSGRRAATARPVAKAGRSKSGFFKFRSTYGASSVS